MIACLYEPKGNTDFYLVKALLAAGANVNAQNKVRGSRAWMPQPYMWQCRGGDGLCNTGTAFASYA